MQGCGRSRRHGGEGDCGFEILDRRRAVSSVILVQLPLSSQCAPQPKEENHPYPNALFVSWPSN